MKKVIIATRNRKTGTIDNGSVLLDDLIEGAYELESATFSNNIYNVNQYNNLFSIDINLGGPSFFLDPLTPGFYSGQEIAALINATASYAIYFTASFDDKTNKFTLTKGTSVNPFTILFGDTSIGTLLGWGDTQLLVTGTASVTTFVAPSCADLIPIKQIFIIIEEDSNKDINGQGYFRASLTLRNTHNSAFGGIFLYEPRTEKGYQEVLFQRKTREITWRMYDERFNPIDFCGNEVTLMLSKSG